MCSPACPGWLKAGLVLHRGEERGCCLHDHGRNLLQLLHKSFFVLLLPKDFWVLCYSGRAVHPDPSVC